MPLTKQKNVEARPAFMSSETFEERHPLMSSKSELDAYDGRTRFSLKSFKKSVTSRMEALYGPMEDQITIPVETDARRVECEPVTEPKMGVKAKINRSMALSKSKDARKTNPSPYATDYTAYIVDCISARKEEAAEERGVQPDLEALKEQFMYKKWNPDIFEPEYFGRNFASIIRQMDDYKKFIEVFGKKTDAYAGLSMREQARVDMASTAYSKLMDCYRSALKLQGLMRLGNGEIIPINKREAEADFTPRELLDRDKEQLRDYVQNSERSFQTMATQIFLKKFFAETKDKRPGAKHYREKREKFIAMARDPQYAESVGKNKDLIERILAEYSSCMQVADQYNETSAYVGDLRDELQQNPEFSGEGDVASDLQYQDSLMRKYYAIESAKAKPFNDAVRTYEQALEHLITGKEMGDETALMLSKFGYEPARIKITYQSFDATYFATFMSDKATGLDHALNRKFPSQVKARQSFLESPHAQKARLLMKKNDEAYNQRVLQMYLDMDEIEKSADGTDMTAKKQSVRDAARQISEPGIRAVIDFNLGDYQSITREQLIERQGALYELASASVMCELASKTESDIPGLSVLEKQLGKPKPDPSFDEIEVKRQKYAMEDYRAKKAVLDAKLEIIKGLLAEVRATAMLSVGSAVIDPPEAMLTEEERQQIANRYADKPMKEKVVLFASDMLAEARTVRAAGEKNWSRVRTLTE